MVDLDENPAPKLRLLKRRLQKNDSTSYDYAGIQTDRPRVRNAPTEWNADTDVQRAGNISASIDKPTAPLAPHPGKQRPLPNRGAPLPEWNSDTTISPSGNDSLPLSQPPTSQAHRQSGQSRATRGSVGRPGRSSPTNVLENDANLSDSVPRRWPPSFHHAAELLTGVGCATVGDFRRFVKEIPVNKIVDATLAADASCASPGCIRDRMEAQKIIEEFIRLIREDAVTNNPIQKVAPKPSAASYGIADSSSVGYTSTQQSHGPQQQQQSQQQAPQPRTKTPLLAASDQDLIDCTLVPGNVAGKGGCPKCGRDVSGRALVMHLKTCQMNVPQTKAADPFTAASNPPAQTNAVAPQPASLQKPIAHTSVPKANPPPSQNLSKPPPMQEQPVEPDAFADEPQLPCPHCGRTFREAVLKRHVGNCLKINKERKQFDVKSQALPAEAVKLHKEVERMEAKQAKNKKNGQSDNSKPPPGQMPAWKAKSEAFRNAIKNARAVDECIKQGKPLNELPAFVPTAPELDDRTQCPHCGRKFGQLQAERHIPICPKGKGKGKGRR